MTAFAKCKKVEAASLTVLEPFFKFELSDDGRFVIVSKGRLAKELQENYGDVITNKDEQIFTFELKAEYTHTGNLFLETWSNYDVNEGWMRKLRCDYLIYFFLHSCIGYLADFPSLQKWAFDEGNIYRFKEKPQRKYYQLNITRGHIVPVSVLREELGPKKFKTFNLNEEPFSSRIIDYWNYKERCANE